MTMHARTTIALVLLAGCAARQPGSALRRAAPPPVSDDLPLAPLLDAVEREASFLEGGKHARTFAFGARTFTQAEYVAALRRFVALGRAAASPAAFLEAVQREFDFYQAFPDGVLVTSYYEPLIRGARSPTERLSQPLYRRPTDLTDPYYTRAEIDSGHALAGRGLEIAWVDPLDAFVLQTEGSGTVALDDGTRLALAYAGNNGRPHVRLSSVLRDAVPRAQMTMQTIEAYLRSLPEREMRRILEQNPRYVFFRSGGGSDGSTTSLGLPTTDGRTIASDPRFCPKGALAYLVSDKPVLAADGSAALGWEPLARFVLDQDTGGGIKGAHVDLFWGRGDEAGRHAGVMKQRGRLWYLAPKR
jgi:membrane-bound lytic murein transglycosylase A